MLLVWGVWLRHFNGNQKEYLKNAKMDLQFHPKQTNQTKFFETLKNYFN